MTTQFLSLNTPDFDVSPWHDELNENFEILDAVLYSLFGVSNLKGLYKNSTEVFEGDRYVDQTDGVIYEVVTTYVTDAFPTTFAEDRANNPANWIPVSIAAALDAAAAAEASAQEAADLVASVSGVADQVEAAETAALAAAGRASAAASSAGTASAAAGSASGSATAADNSAIAAGTSETNAGNSALAAATSETNAGNSATAAGTSATNASNSSIAASGFADDAEDSAAAALDSESNASDSEDAANDSAIAAAASELAAAGSASAADASADEAAASALEVTTLPVTIASGTNYTLILSDAGKAIRTTSDADMTITIPPNSAVAFPQDTWIAIEQFGLGQITISLGSGVTLFAQGAKYSTFGRYSTAWLHKSGTNEWLFAGDIVV